MQCCDTERPHSQHGCALSVGLRALGVAPAPTMGIVSGGGEAAAKKDDAGVSRVRQGVRAQAANLRTNLPLGGGVATGIARPARLDAAEEGQTMPARARHTDS